MPATPENTALSGKKDRTADRDGIGLILAPFLAAKLITLVSMSLRTKTLGGENLNRAKKDNRSVIYAFWHNRSFLMTYVLRNKQISAMISRSKDGEISSRTISRFGGLPVRGSTNKGGAQAFVTIIRRLKKGGDAVITPDGPQGPLCRVQPGVVHLAAKSSSPVIPAAFSVSRKVSLKSWDKFIIPIPFSRALVVYGEPVYVSKNDDIEEKRTEIELALQQTTQFADSYFN